MDIASTGKIFTKLVKRHCHDAVRCIERLFHAVSVVDVDINVEHSLVRFEELQNAKHAVVDVTEAASLTLLSVMKTTRPIYSNVTNSLIKTNRTA